MNKNTPYLEVESTRKLPQPVGGLVWHCAFQYIDFNEVPDYAVANHFRDCMFLGCKIPKPMEKRIDSDCLVFPRMGMEYKAFTNSLYTGDTLYDGFNPSDESTFENCFDTIVYKKYIEKGKKAECIKDTISRAIHDHSISNAMDGLLDMYAETDVCAIMGGHAMKRTDESYEKVVRISKKLTEAGKLMVSGGGPGAMEATHLGAWMAGRNEEELQDALRIVSASPTFKDPHWLSTAFEVRSKYPQHTFHSLGVPTWFYGHEPATPFATDIAKYFDNSIREDGILSIAKGGIIYSPGAAGTMQEVFQDAAQNHYTTYGYASPMVFLGVDYFTSEVPVYPFLCELLKNGKYNNLILSITDDCDEVVNTLKNFRKPE